MTFDKTGNQRGEQEYGLGRKHCDLAQLFPLWNQILASATCMGGHRGSAAPLLSPVQETDDSLLVYLSDRDDNSTKYDS